MSSDLPSSEMSGPLHEEASLKAGPCFLGSQPAPRLPCRTELVALSAKNSIWQQPSACASSLPLSSAEVESPGADCDNFHLLLQKVELHHHREVSLVRAELERQLEDLRRRVEGTSMADGGINTADDNKASVTFAQLPPNAKRGTTGDTESNLLSDTSTSRAQTPHSDFMLSEPAGNNFSTSTLIVQKSSETQNTVPFTFNQSGMHQAIVMHEFKRRNRAADHTSLVSRFSSFMQASTSNTRWGKLATTVVRSQLFDGVCAKVIMSNAILLGISTDIAARNANPDDVPVIFTYADRMFSCLFFLELILRMTALGGTRFFVGREWKWNIFDLVVVSTDLAETGAAILTGGSTSVLQNLTAIRMLRVLRLVRTIRVIRLVRFFKEMRMMVFSVLKSGLLLLWSMILLIIILFMFSVYFTQVATFYRHFHNRSDDEHEVNNKLRTYFGSLITAGYMLFQCMSGGISWGEVGVPLLEIHWSNSLVLCFFIFFTVFAVLNIITGIFVDTAIRSAQDQHEIIQDAIHTERKTLDQMRTLFENTDMDQSGGITFQELREQLAKPQVRAHLGTLGLEVNDASSIFRLLDVDRSGEISMQEFIFGCLRMRGGAKSLDLVILILEHRRMKEKVGKVFTLLQEGLKQQHKTQERLESLVAVARLTQT